MRVPVFLLPALLLIGTMMAQAPDTAGTAPMLQTGTQLVVVDVVVVDSHGKPVHALKREDFNVTEDKTPQTISHFEEHSNLTPPTPGQTLPPLPPGTFTDYTPLPPNGVLNVLLLDSLNTPMTDQAYVRYELQQYVKKAKPGTRIAIFGLAQHLFFLQGFTQDPQTLKDAVEHKLIPRGSVLLDDPAGTGGVESLSDTMADEGIAVSSNLSQFEAETSAFQTQLRTQYTLDAFNTLAHYLASFPGRKNLIWFSGSFPIDILPDPSLENGFSVMEENDEQFRETTNLLAQAQVSVYPVDARGLMTNPAFSAAQSGSKFARDPRALGKAVSDFSTSQAEEHMTMDQLADDTGGKAFYNNNDLASAVSKAIELGSNFYTVEYTPTHKKWNEDYRSIKIKLAPQYAAAGYKLAYRQGYYADQPLNPKGKKSQGTSGTTTVAATEELTSGASYARAAMARGAPMPADLLFKVRVLPATTTTEDTLAQGNQVDPQHPIKPPFRRYMVDFASLTDAVKLKVTADGHHQGDIEFIALLYDNDGRLLNATSEAVQMNMTAETYAHFKQGMGAHLEISAPVKGDTFLRVGVHDMTSNKFGVVEVPLATIARLAPPPAPPVRPAATTTAPSAAPAPAK